MDYRGLYKDLLAMEQRLLVQMFHVPDIDSFIKVDHLYHACRSFRIDLLERFYSLVGRVHL